MRMPPPLPLLNRRLTLGPDATPAKTESGIIRIFTKVGQDDWDTPCVIRFCDIFSLANDAKETGVAADETWSENILFHLSGSITWKRSPSSARSRQPATVNTPNFL